MTLLDELEQARFPLEKVDPRWGGGWIVDCPLDSRRLDPFRERYALIPSGKRTIVQPKPKEFRAVTDNLSLDEAKIPSSPKRKPGRPKKVR